MPEKDEKPKRGRKPIAANPAANPAPTSSSEKKSIGKKPIPSKKADSTKEDNEDDKAAQIAQALFGD